MTIRLGEINGQPAMLITLGGELVGVTVPDAAGGRIHTLRSVLNPAKLEHVRAQLSRSGALAGPVLVSGGERAGTHGGDERGKV